MLKKCANIACVVEFEPSRSNHTYCSRSCRVAVLANTKEYIEKHTFSTLAWQKRNPEKRIEAKRKQAKKTYLSGKLPPWMTER